MQRHVPPDLLARLTAYDMLGSFIAIPVGEVAAGPVSHVIGVRPALLGCGLVIVAAIVAMIAHPSVRNLIETKELFGVASRASTVQLNTPEEPSWPIGTTSTPDSTDRGLRS